MSNDQDRLEVCQRRLYETAQERDALRAEVETAASQLLAQIDWRKSLEQSVQTYVERIATLKAQVADSDARLATLVVEKNQRIASLEAEVERLTKGDSRESASSHE